jgi:hypothetical protein
MAERAKERDAVAQEDGDPGESDVADQALAQEGLDQLSAVDVGPTPYRMADEALGQYTISGWGSRGED